MTRKYTYFRKNRVQIRKSRLGGLQNLTTDGLLNLQMARQKAPSSGKELAKRVGGRRVEL